MNTKIYTVCLFSEKQLQMKQQTALGMPSAEKRRAAKMTAAEKILREHGQPVCEQYMTAS